VEEPSIPGARVLQLGRVLEDDDGSGSATERDRGRCLLEDAQRNGIPVVAGHRVEIADAKGYGAHGGVGGEGRVGGHDHDNIVERSTIPCRAVKYHDSITHLRRGALGLEREAHKTALEHGSRVRPTPRALHRMTSPVRA